MRDFTKTEAAKRMIEVGCTKEQIRLSLEINLSFSENSQYPYELNRDFHVHFLACGSMASFAKVRVTKEQWLKLKNS